MPDRPVKIVREATDPLALRASIGGSSEYGYYLVWRGENPLAVLTMLRDVLAVAEEALPKEAGE
jgi:hypothetical protein